MGTETDLWQCLKQAQPALRSEGWQLPVTEVEKLEFTNQVERRATVMEEFFPIDELFPATTDSLCRWWRGVLLVPLPISKEEYESLQIQHDAARHNASFFQGIRSSIVCNQFHEAADAYRAYNNTLTDIRQARQEGKCTLQTFLEMAMINVPEKSAANLIASVQYGMLCTWRLPSDDDSRLILHVQELEAWTAKGVRTSYRTTGLNRMSKYFQRKNFNIIDAGLAEAYRILKGSLQF